MVEQNLSEGDYEIRIESDDNEVEEVEETVPIKNDKEIVIQLEAATFDD